MTTAFSINYMGVNTRRRSFRMVIRLALGLLCSKQLNDGYHAQLQTLMDSEPVNPCIKVHKSCVSRYTSITNIHAHLAYVRKSCDNDDSEESVPKRLRSTIRKRFDFRNCLLYTSPSPRDGLLSRMPSSA